MLSKAGPQANEMQTLHPCGQEHCGVEGQLPAKASVTLKWEEKTRNCMN